MHNHQLNKIFRVLSVEERERVRQYLKQQYASERASVFKLFNYLDNYYKKLKTPPPAKDKKLDKQYVAQRLFGRQKYEINIDTKLRDTEVKLFQKIKEVLIEKQFEQNPEYRQLLLTSIFAQHNLYDFFEDSTQDIFNTINSKKQKDTSDYFILSHLNEQLFFHPSTEKFKQDATLLDESIHDMNRGYLLCIFRFFCEKLHRKAIIEQVESIEQSELVFAHRLASMRYASDPTLKIYTQLISLQQQEHIELSELAIIIVELKEFGDHLLKKDLQIISHKLVYLSNFVYEESNSKALHTIFSIYEFVQQHGLLIYNNSLSLAYFINAVAVAAAIEKFEWAEDFMKENLKYIQHELQEEASAAANGYIHYYKGAYKQATHIFNTLQRSHNFTKIHIQVLWIKCLFELFLNGDQDIIDTLKSKIENFRRNLKNLDAFHEEKIEAIKAFLSFVKKLIRVIHKNKRITKEKQKLQKELDNITRIICRKWLEEKLDEIFQDC